MMVVMVRMDPLPDAGLAGDRARCSSWPSSVSRRASPRSSTDARVKESAFWSVAQRTMGAIRVIQAFTTEEEEHRRFVDAQHGEPGGQPPPLHVPDGVLGLRERADRGRDGGRALGRRQARARRRRSRVGDVLVFTSYLASLYAPINSLTQTWGLIQGAKVGRGARLRDPGHPARPARRRARAGARRGARRDHLRGRALRLRRQPRGAARRRPSTRAPAR